jgi:hypothetical protein
MRRTWIVLAALATTIAGGVPLAQAQDSTTQQAQDNTTQNGITNGITMGGHIGFVLPLVTHVGGRTINDTADQFSIGFPVGVTFKGSGRMAFDLELVPFINTAPPRQTTVLIHPGLVWSLGHGWGAGARLAFDVNSSDWGFTPLVNHSWPFRSEHGFFKSYFIEADLPVRFNRPVNAPATNAVTFAMHFGLGF